MQRCFQTDVVADIVNRLLHTTASGSSAVREVLVFPTFSSGGRMLVLVRTLWLHPRAPVKSASRQLSRQLSLPASCPAPAPVTYSFTYLPRSYVLATHPFSSSFPAAASDLARSAPLRRVDLLGCG